MSLKSEIEKLKYDKRLTEWHLNQGKLSRDELNRYLAELPDLASNVETFRLSEEASADFYGNGSGNGSLND